MGAYIEFQNARKMHKMGEVEIQALTGVDLTINKGEFVVIAGANGAGESTILDILGGIDSSTNGSIFVDGTEISKFDIKQLITYRHYNIGFVFQFYNPVQNLTVKEDVGLATQTYKQPLDIGEAIEAVGLKERVPNFPVQLSGGEQQRVAIARVLVKNPKFLLCDRPAGAPDYSIRKQILRLLQDARRQCGVSVVVITHNLTLTAMRGKVIKARDGRIDGITINEHLLPVEGIKYWYGKGSPPEKHPTENPQILRSLLFHLCHRRRRSHLLRQSTGRCIGDEEYCGYLF